MLLFLCYYFIQQYLKGVNNYYIYKDFYYCIVRI